MQKNESIVSWLGWVVVLSNIVSFCLGLLDFWNIRNLPIELYLILSNLSGVLAVFPRGIPLILSIRDGHVNFLAFVIPLWALVMMWCGYGILKFKKISKIVFIILCYLHIVIFLFSRLIALVAYPHSSSPGILFRLLYEGAWIVSVIYIVILNRPKIKELFR